MLSSDASQSLIVNNDRGFTPMALFKLRCATAMFNSDNQIVVKIIPQLFQCS